MTDIEKKALALVNEVAGSVSWTMDNLSHPYNRILFQALCRAIEQHEAFRQEVSDAIYVDVVAQVRCGIDPKFRTNSVRFVITKPDPLVEIMAEVNDMNDAKAAEQLREALAKRGGKIVWEEG